MALAQGALEISPRVLVVLAAANFALPLIAVIGAWVMGLWQQSIPVCNPFWAGCLTISRAARTGDAIFLFRGIMLPLVPLFAAYWVVQSIWLRNAIGRSTPGIRSIIWLGLCSALALLCYVNFLGTDGEFARFMRRQGVMLYFGLASLAQLVSLYLLNKYRVQLGETASLWIGGQWTFVVAQWVLGLTSVIAAAWQPEYEDRIRNAVEWQYALLMVGFYAMSAGLWWHHWAISERPEPSPTRATDR